MKIAILLAGQARKYDDPMVLFPMLRFIKQFGETDLFLSTWSKRGFSQDHGAGKAFDTSYNTVSKDELLATYPNVKGVHIEEEDVWLETLDPYYKQIYQEGFDWNSQHFRGTVVPQLYTIYMANKLKQEYEKENNFTYDLVIRTRFDNLHLCYINPLDLVDLTKVYTLNYPPHYYPERIYDVFFYTNSKNMDTFCKSYDFLKEVEEYDFDNGLHPRDSNRMFYIMFKANQIDVVDLQYNVCETFR